MAEVNTTVAADFTPRFLEHLDGRTIAAKLLRERLNNLQNDLGGESRLSYAQRSLCRRAIWLESYIETQETNAATGETVDIGRQVQALNSLLGLYRTLGLQRIAKDSIDLGEYLAAR